MRIVLEIDGAEIAARTTPAVAPASPETAPAPATIGALDAGAAPSLETSAPARFFETAASETGSTADLTPSPTTATDLDAGAAPADVLSPPATEV